MDTSISAGMHTSILLPGILRQALRRGAFHEVNQLLEQVQDDRLTKPETGLLLAKLRLRQGHCSRAQEALSAINIADAQTSPAQRILVRVQQAAVAILSSLDLDSILQEADAILAEAYDLPPGDQGEVERVWASIQLSAAVFYERSPEEAHLVHERLFQIADTLAQSGRIDEALTAKLLWADRKNDVSASFQRLKDVIDQAAKWQHWCAAGEAGLRLAERQLDAHLDLHEIRTSLTQAQDYLHRGESVAGLMDCRRIEARLEMERGTGSTSLMERCLDECLAEDYITGAFLTLQSLSVHAHSSGEIARAEHLLMQGIELTREAGLFRAIVSFAMARVDLLTRTSRFGEAIEVAQNVRLGLPPYGQGAMSIQLGTIYALIGDTASAIREARIGLNLYLALGATEFVSPARAALANQLIATGESEDWQEASQLLHIGIEEDLSRGAIGDAIAKQEVLIQSMINRYRASPIQNADLLIAAEAAIEKAEADAATLIDRREATVRQGACLQMRALIAAVRDDNTAMEIAQTSAANIYANGGLMMEAANAHYLLGSRFLNEANVLSRTIEQREQSAVTAAGHLDKAFQFYQRAGMSAQMADTRFLAARLFMNIAIARRLRGIASQDLERRALESLGQSEQDMDQIRRAFAPADPLDAQAGKHAIAARTRKIYELAVDVCLHGMQRDVAAGWRWVQRGKARTLVDAMSTGNVVPLRTLQVLRKTPNALAWLQLERDLRARLQAAPAESRLSLRGELDAHWQAMPDVPGLREYRDLRQGAAWNDMQLPLGNDRHHAGERHNDQKAVFVDWFAIKDQLYLFAMRPSALPEVFLLPTRESQVRRFISDYLSENFRLTLRDDPTLLDAMAPLVEPLGWVSQPGELLVLCPTGAMNGLPLHALTVERMPLLERNPVVYTPSLTALNHCLSRRRRYGEALTKAAVFGDPNGDRPATAELLAYLGQRYGIKSFQGSHVTRQRFLSALRRNSIIHFQGHAIYELSQPLNSHLIFVQSQTDVRGNEEHKGVILTARDIIREAAVHPGALVILGACASATQDIHPGDEPVGLIAALLQAGAGAVLAALWRVHAESAAAFMQEFYDSLQGTEGLSLNRAEAMRKAALAVRDRWPEPYHWAAFTLNGDWRL